MTKGIYIIQKIDRMNQLPVRNEHGGLMGAFAIPIYGTQPPSAVAYVGVCTFSLIVVLYPYRWRVMLWLLLKE